MAGFSFGEIIICDFPFSDGVRSKPRPALFLTSHPDGDLLVARITSNPRETEFDVTLKDSALSNLIFDSVVRVSKLATILPTSAKKKIGSLSERDKKEVKEALRSFVESFI
jgi:mRNA-degrading endonuclease toxin of MazEF toxin-antitoxin module